MTPKLGFELVDGLLFLWLLYRAFRLKRQVDEFRPDRTVRYTLPATILTRVS